MRTRSSLLVLPFLFWLIAFVLSPLLIVIAVSFLERGTYGGIEPILNFNNYTRTLDPIYVNIAINSIFLAVLTSLSCLIIGFPMAYVMATTRVHLRWVLLILVIIPFWTNFVVRAHAIRLFFSDLGPLNSLMVMLGWIREPLPLRDSPVSLWMGMVTSYLPFMVLPLFVVLDRFDFSLIEAAQDLGASRTRTFFTVVLPVSSPGIRSGLLFVFTPALGEFVIPDLLGGARVMMVGNLISDQFLKVRNWPFGSALSLLLMVAVLLSVIFSDKKWGGHVSTSAN
jgi:spermidine/putrescine transport system permease protein